MRDLAGTAAEFLIESASMGVVGGLLGSSVGVLIVMGVSAYQVWTPVLDPLAPCSRQRSVT
jgi:macrolide transport system ATP-binding/permease protein